MTSDSATTTAASVGTPDPVSVLRASTPAGPFTALLGADEHGADAVCAAGFTADASRLLALLPASAVADGPAETPLAREVHTALEAYLAGDLDALAAVPVTLGASQGFRDAAWHALRGIPAGRTISYQRLAERAGSPAAVRAAGSACARNRVALFVPCHRVIRGDGTLGGYAYGLPVKRWLLAHERADGID